MLLLWHWFMHYSGADNGKWYPWWSGPGSDLGELTLLVAMVAYFRGHSCHVKGCWRHGRHPYRHYMLCAKHHPDVPSAGITHEHIRTLKAGDESGPDERRGARPVDGRSHGHVGEERVPAIE